MDNKRMKTWIEIQELYSNENPNATRTKKALEEDWNTSDVTITKSIEASTLPTSSREYTIAELLEWFIPARRLIEEGKKYEEVKQIMLEKRKASKAESDGNIAFDSLQELQDELISVYLRAGLKQRVKQIGGHVMVSALRELLETPDVKKELIEYTTITVENIFNQSRAIKAAKATTQKLLKATDEGEKQP